MFELTNLFGSLTSFALSLPHKILPAAVAIIGFGLVIFIHELGHFVFCKAFNVSVPFFSIGFGPVLVKRKIGGTQFQVAAIPLGGYNEIKDEVVVDANGKEVPTEDSFRAKPYWQKLIILLGGIFFNALTAVFLFSTIAKLGPVYPPLKSLKIIKVLADSPAQTAGLQANDIIVGVQTTKFSEQADATFASFGQYLQKNLSQTVSLQILQSSGEINQKEVILDSIDEVKRRGSILGVELEPEFDASKPTASIGLFAAITIGIRSTYAHVIGVLGALKHMFVQRSIEALGGPVMIIAQSFKHAKQGIIPLLFFLAAISISLAVLNFFPLGALDGGKLLVESAEALVGRPIPALRMLTGFGTLILLGLFLLLTYKDFMRLFIG